MAMAMSSARLNLVWRYNLSKPGSIWLFLIGGMVTIQDLLFNLAAILINPEVVFFGAFDDRKLVVRTPPVGINVGNEKSLGLDFGRAI